MSGAVPPQKIVPGTNFTVDAFRYPSPSVKGYFLSHAHSDHYTGLKETWSHGPIYCSAVTAELVQHMLGVGSQWLHPLPLDKPVLVDGVEVTLVCANHCPGAVQFLFALPDGRKYVHTGDMRYCAAMAESPALQRFRGSDALYLDTTYCHPKHCFPPQEESIEYVASTIHRLMQESSFQPPPAVRSGVQKQQQQEEEGGEEASKSRQGLPGAQQKGQRQSPEHEVGRGRGARPSRLFLISTYGVGKERILEAVVRRCGVRLHVTEKKQGVMRCLELAGYSAEELFTTDKGETCIHVVQWGFLGETWPFFRPNFVNMESYRQEHGVDEVVGFVPTGWLHEMKKQTFSVRRKGASSVHLVPYSEHSSFTELLEYVQVMRPHKVVPTVGVGGEDAEKCAAKMMKHFRHLVDETASKAKFLSAFRRQSSGLVPGFGSGAAAAAAAEAAAAAAAMGAGSSMQGAGTFLGACHEEERGAESEGGREGGEGDEGGKDPGGLDCVKGSEDGAEDGAANPKQAGAKAGGGALGRKRTRGEEAQQSGEVISLLESEEEEEAGRQGEGGAPRTRSSQHRQQRERQGRESYFEAGAAAGAAAEAVGKQGSDEQRMGEAGPSGSNSAPYGAATVTAAAARSPAHARECEALVYLESVLGNSLSQGEALQLLVAAGNDPQRAINMHLDGWKPPQPGAGQAAAAAPAAAPSRGGSKPTAASNGRGATAGSGRGGGQRKGSAAGAGPKPKRQKAGNGISAAGSGSTAAAVPAGQRSILSFFGAGPASPSPSPSRPASNVAPLVPSGAGAVREVANATEHSTPMPSLESPAAGVAAAAATTKITQEGRHQKGSTKSPQHHHHPHQHQQQEEQEVEVKEEEESEGQQQAASGEVEQETQGAAAVEGVKPKLLLPLPPSPSAGPGAFFGGGKLAQRGGGDRADQVPRNAVALPLDKYDPVGHASWEAGQPTPYLHLSRAFDAMDATTKRLSITDVLVNTFRSVLALSPEDLAATAYLATGTVAPEYEGMELNVGGSTVAAAVQEATGVSRARLREMYKELGDIGDVALACKRTQATLVRPAPLTVQGVLSTLRGLASEKGQGSAARRQRSVLGMLRAGRESETKYITRTLVQALRVRANWRSVIPALAKATLIHREGVKVPKARLEAAGAAATTAFHVCPNLDKLVGALLEGGPDEVQSRCTLTPGIPIKPMLAKPGEGFGDAISQLKSAPFLAEYKYDGVRAQVHLLADGQVKIFSRNCEDRTGSYPDVAAQVREAAQGGATSLILDAELVAVERDPAGGEPRLRAFQELSSRPRVDVDAGSISVAVCVYAFDLLYADGISLLGLPLWRRRQALLKALPNMRPGYVSLAQSQAISPSGSFPAGMELDGPATAALATAAASAPAPATANATAAPSSAGPAAGQGLAAASPAAAAGPPLSVEDAQAEDKIPESGTATVDLPAGPVAPPAAAPAPVQAPSPEELEEAVRQALLEAFAAGTEGLMLKSLAVAYEPSKRSESWVKLKKDYIQGLSDTLDLVPIGAWYGNGRKVGWFSPFLLAVWDPENEELQSICRCMSGFSDAFYKEATARLKETVIPGPKPYYRTGEVPDVWFEPKEVWEIRGADLSISPVHKAAMGRLHLDRGAGLRFPRFLRIRDDKTIEDASSADTIVELYNAQTRKVERSGQPLAASGRTAGGPRPFCAQGPLAAGLEAQADEEADSDEEEEAGERQARELEI